MAKPGSGSCSDSNKASQNVVFVDTSLDTHLALFVSDSDTVSDLKSNLFLPSPDTFFLFSFLGFVLFVLLRGFCLGGWHFGVFVWRNDFFIWDQTVYISMLN